MIAERRTTLVLAAAIIALALVVALVVALALAEPVREQLHLPFGGVPATPDTAVSIFAVNARLLAIVFAMIALTQIQWSGPAATFVVAFADALLGLLVAFNAIVVGAALGAYGTRMFTAILPHGPVELAVFAVALALYVRARESRIHARHVAAVGIACVTGLALAAVLETFAGL